MAFIAACIAWAVGLPLAAVATAWHVSGVGQALVALAYQIGHVICHQRTERSFHLMGVQLPVCARCTGIYLGAAASAIVAAGGHTPSAPIDRTWARAALGWSFAPIAVTLLVEWVSGRTPANWIRAVSAVPLGLVVAWIVCGVAAPSARRNVID